MPSFKEAMAFWGYMYKKGLLGIILYFLSFLVFFMVAWWIAHELSVKYFMVSPWLTLIIAIAILPLLFFYIPIMPRSYEFQFKGKIRQDIPEAELKELLIEMTRKSLEIAAMVIMLMCVLCLMVYGATRYLAISDTITLALVVATAFNIFLISLVAISLGGYNKDLLHKTFTEEEYKRYTSLSNYRNTFFLLVAFDALIGILINSMLSSLTVGMTAILLVAVIINVILAIGLWNYLIMRSENERKAMMPQMKISLAILIMADLIFIAAFIVQKVWIGASYERTVLMMFTAFVLVMGILGIIRLILASIHALRQG